MSHVTLSLVLSLLASVTCWICHIYFCLVPAASLLRPHWGSEAPPHLTLQSIASPDDFYLPNVLESVSLTDTSLIQAIVSCLDSYLIAHLMFAFIPLCAFIPTHFSQTHMAPGTCRISFLCEPKWTPLGVEGKNGVLTPVVTLNTVNID